MEARAIARYVRMSPRKVRRVMYLVRGKDVTDALATLKFVPNRAARAISKVIQSAAANAENLFGAQPRELRIKACWVDPGPVMKRIQPRAMGRAYPILKRTSHITVIVEEKGEKASPSRAT